MSHWHLKFQHSLLFTTLLSLSLSLSVSDLMRSFFSLKTPIKPLPHYLSTRLLSSSRFNNSPTSMAIPPPPSAKSVAAVDSEVGLAKRSWIKFRRESVLALYTPFVLCLASGNLRVETFRHYIAQDVYFLRAFAQA